MKSRFQAVLALAALLCLGSACATTSPDRALQPAAESGPGGVVEEAAPNSALEKAGLRPGDLLVAWERLPAKGEIRTAFDWSWVKTEQAPRGTLRLQGWRDGAAISLDVPRGRPWDARVRPRMAADLLQTYQEGRQQLTAGDLEGGIALWEQLVQRVEPRAAPGLRSWLLLQIGDAWAKGGQVEKARAALRAALSEAEDAQTRVALWEELGKSHELANEMVRAELSFRSALEVGEAAWGESLQTAGTMARLGHVLVRQNRLDEAEKLLGRSLEVRQCWAPDSLPIADSLIYLAGAAWSRGDLEAMSGYARRALILQERWSPDSPEMARALNPLGILATQQGRFEEAAAAFQRALTIQERLAPGSPLVAVLLTNLGTVARARGDEESAVELFQRSLEIWERLSPAHIGIAVNSTNLGTIARDRGELARAAELFQRTLTIWGKAAPEGLGVAGGYDTLGDVTRMRGDLDGAWDLHRRALEIYERLAPGSLDSAIALQNLGKVAEARGDLDQALDFYQRARTIHERLTPGTIQEALTLQQLGRLYRRMRRPDQAAQLVARAVDALESQVGRLGGSQDLQASYRASYVEIYVDAIEVALEQGRAAEAFYLVERSRARSFLTLLSERDLTFPGEVPAEIERSRRDNAARYDQTLRDLMRWTPAAGEEARENFHRELGRLRRERDGIAAELRRASPRLASLREPQPLDLAAAREALDPGTLALSYSVGKDQTALFAVTREGGLRVEVLPVGEERLRRDVETFREKVQMQEAPVDLARSLYSTLIGPVAGLIERSERVLILPDGPLHRLPFGALIRDTTGQYLTEWKPLHTTLSLTVYGTLRRGEPSRSAGLIAFGDPRYPKDVAASGETRDPVLRSPGLRSFDWAPLPYSRREVERIAEVYPKARLYLAEEATEERAKAATGDARVLHFAAHGYVDDRTPLDSALVLTIPEGLPAGRDNGLLQVWEIFESVRLDADLVVLSACESALGRELSGEGMIGLTRAFQYAGARSVAASLWSVPDQVTAELMTRFHRHLAAGLPKDEALRAAQVELLRKPVAITVQGQSLEMDVSAPFFWAAFQLFGDWR